MSKRRLPSENQDSTLTSYAPPAEAPAAGIGQKLLTIFKIAEILATQQETERMLTSFLTCLIETFDAADGGILVLYNESDDLLMPVASNGYNAASMMQIRLAVGESRCGKAFKTGEAELYPTSETIVEARADLTPSNRNLVEAANRGLGQATSAVCIPLSTAESKIGVLMLESRNQPRVFDSEDVTFLQAVGGLIALSIENSRLRDELQVTSALEEANRLKAELISTLAHEMRTPLTSIKGYSTALLMEEISFAIETQHEFLRIIDEETDVLQDLIRDLLESSTIDAGLLRLEPQPVRLPRLVEEVLQDLARRASQHRFVVDFTEHFPIVDVDPNRTAQVLRNLLDNAVKYSPSGGLVVVKGEAKDDEVVISVADQGIGIAPEHLNRLFEKFFRVESGLGRHVVGSGLGLPISRTIVESQGGRIWAESQPGQGSTFYFTLPLKVTSQQLREEG